jgi:hypothetical protein
MSTKIQNNVAGYITRVKLASSAAASPMPAQQATAERIEQERRFATGTIVRRGYIQLPPKR